MKPGDRVKIILTDSKEVHGILMPRPELFGDEKVVLKLTSGYNIGIDKKNIKEIIPEKDTAPKHTAYQNKKKQIIQDASLKKLPFFIQEVLSHHKLITAQAELLRNMILKTFLNYFQNCKHLHVLIV